MTDDNTDEGIREHLDRQRGLFDDAVRLDDGRVVRVGGNADNADAPAESEGDADGNH